MLYLLTNMILLIISFYSIKKLISEIFDINENKKILNIKENQNNDIVLNKIKNNKLTIRNCSLLLIAILALFLYNNRATSISKILDIKNPSDIYYFSGSLDLLSIDKSLYLDINDKVIKSNFFTLLDETKVERTSTNIISMDHIYLRFYQESYGMPYFSKSISIYDYGYLSIGMKYYKVKDYETFYNKLVLLME